MAKATSYAIGYRKVESTLLRSDLTKGGQDVNLCQLWQLSDHRLRIQIRSDSYRDQCHAVAERWDGGRWQEVYRIAPAGMSTPDKLLYSREPLLPQFTADIDSLIAAVRLVLL